MLTCGQNARRMGRDDANLADGGCSECMACGDRALTRRAFASLAGLAAGSVLLGVLPGCAGSDAGQTAPAKDFTEPRAEGMRAASEGEQLGKKHSFGKCFGGRRAVRQL